jgi:hypothetical protein
MVSATTLLHKHRTFTLFWKNHLDKTQSIRRSEAVPVTCVTPVVVVSCGPVLKMYIIDSWQLREELKLGLPNEKELYA